MIRRFVKFAVLVLLANVANSALALEPKSGYEYIREDTREMQNDDFANPGMKAVEQGSKLFNEIGVNGKSCATCHGENGSKFDPKRIARFPVFNEEFQKPFTLQNQINFCWEEQLDNVPYIPDCVELIRLEAFIRNRARGEKVNVDITGPLKPFYEAGEKVYHTRVGQTNMACANCHDQYAGQMLRGQMLSQGHTNGFPEYRLGSGKVTSLQGRVDECFRSFRAEPYERGAKELINLEVYLHARGNGLPIETPAVRY